MEYRDTTALLRKFVRFFCILTIILLAGSLVSRAQVFTHDSGPLNDPDSWSGDPQNFTDDGQTFIIEGEAATDDDWLLSGAGTRLIIDTDADITFPAGNTVTFDGITIEFGDQAGGTLIANSDIVVQNGTEWGYEQPEDVWSLIFGQDGSQSVTAGDQSEFMAFDIQADATEGTFDLLAHDAPTVVLHALNNLDLDFTDNALFRDNGNTIMAGRNISLDGAADSYQLAGTLTHQVSGASADYIAVAPQLNNLNLIARGDANPRFRSAQNHAREISVNGNFTADIESSSDLEFNDVELIIGGNLTLDHHRPEESPGQGIADFSDAIITVDNDLYLNVSGQEESQTAGILAGNGAFSVGGSVFLDASGYGSAHLGSSLFNIQGDVDVSLSGAGTIDLDDTEVYIDRNLAFGLESRGDLRFGTSYIFVMQDVDLTHHRPENSGGAGMVAGEQAIIDIVGNFNITLSGDEPDESPNLDLDRAEIVAESDMNLLALEYGVLALSEAVIEIPNGSLFLEGYNQSSLNLGDGIIISGKNLDILLDETSGTDFANSSLNARGNVTIDAADQSTLDSEEFGLTLSGSSDQTLSGLHSVTVHTFGIEKDGGFVNLQSDLTASSMVTIDLENDAVFSDGGHTLATGYAAVFRGSGNAFDFTGELLLTETPLTKNPVLQGLQNGSGGSANPAADNGSGQISFIYEQLTGRDVRFDLFIQDELPEDPAEPFESFTLSAENETESTGTLSFDNDHPYIVFLQDQQASGGSVAISDLEWMLPGEDPAGPVARARLIHNAADPAIDVLDIYINDELFAEEVAFRQASSLVTLPADSSLQISVFGHGADPDEEDALFTMDDAVFSEGGSYSIISSGVSGDGFAANPDGEATGFNLHILETTPSADDGELVNFVLWHGVTDAPAVDIWIQDGPALMDGASYTDQTQMFTAMASDYQFNVGLDGDSSGDPLIEITGDLSAAAGSGAIILASGFLEPQNNEDGPGFGLLVVLSDGSTFLMDASETYSEPDAGRPDSFVLGQNYPNPFNPVTSIAFSLPESSSVTLEVFDLQGRRVATLVDGRRSAGDHTVTFDAAHLSSGVYLYRLQAGDFVRSRQMMLVK